MHNTSERAYHEAEPDLEAAAARQRSEEDSDVRRLAEDEILALMRSWLADDAPSRLWVASFHDCGERYARAQVWQVRSVLAERLRTELRALPPETRPRWARFDTEVLLAAVMIAAKALAGRGSSGTQPPPKLGGGPATERRDGP